MKPIVVLALLVLAAVPASASIVLFTDGRVQKIADYKLVDDETIELSLRGGGAMTMPLGRVERIVDDEVADPPPAAPVVAALVEQNGVFPARSWKYDPSRAPLFKTKYDETIVAAAKKFDVDAALISAVIKAESDYNPRTRSNKGARGLMQLMPATAARFGVHNSYDPTANIFGGVRYLRWLLEKFEGNADLAVAAYNAGEGNVWKYNGVPPFRETVTYINRIAKHIRSAAQTAAASVSAATGAMAERN
jgi:soluble lytic murein transglycosylase-like protein